MAGNAGFALIDGQQLFLWIQGQMVHGHGREQAIGEALLQGATINGGTQGRFNPPPFSRWIKAAAISHQVPPADAGRGTLLGWQRAEQSDALSR